MFVGERLTAQRCVMRTDPDRPCGQALLLTRVTTGQAKRFPADVARRAARKLEYVHLATRLDDLKVPPGNRLHSLKDDRK